MQNGRASILKIIAIIFGIGFLIIGVLGFVPQAKVGEDLFGLFRVNTIHNIIYLISGVIALLGGLSCWHATRVYFKIFGIIYGLAALLGIYFGHGDLLDGYIANNTNDEWLHGAIAVVFLYLGFGCCWRCRSCEKV